MRFLPYLLTGLLCACVSSGHKIDQAKADRIEKGITTRDGVRKLIGSPDSIVKDSDGMEIWTYMHFSASSKPESFIPIIGMFAGGVNTTSHTVMIQFGPDGTVSKTTSTMSGGDISNGFGSSTSDPASLRPVKDGKRAK